MTLAPVSPEEATAWAHWVCRRAGVGLADIGEARGDKAAPDRGKGREASQALRSFMSRGARRGVERLRMREVERKLGVPQSPQWETVWSGQAVQTMMENSNAG